MSNPTFTVTVKGQPVTFTSAFADLAGAYKALAAIGNPGDFALSLLEKARARQLSPAQIAWLHKLATDAQPVANLDLSPVVAMMDKAASAQKRAPRVTLQLSSGSQLVLKMLMQGSHVGEVSITNGLPWGHPNRVYYGHLAGGTTHKSGSWTQEVEALLRRLAAEPLKVAAQHGVATGNCCFCGRELSTAESRTAGYGPICASKFGLEWGDTSTADAADKEAKQAFSEKPKDPSMIGPFVRKVSDCYQGDDDEMREHARQEGEAARSTEAQNDIFRDDRSMSGAADDYRNNGTSRNWTGD